MERLQAWAHEHGRPPTLEEWRRAGARHPSAATVRRLFGSWNAALVAAGFEMRPPGVPVEPRSATHARCERPAVGLHGLLDTQAAGDGSSVDQPAARSEGGRMSATTTTVARITNVVIHPDTEAAELYRSARVAGFPADRA